MIGCAILGYGTVGSGVYNVIRSNCGLVNERAGDDIEVRHVLDLREFPGDPVESILTHDFEDIVNDPEVRIVVEVMGGLKPAFDFTKRCLEAGKNVCTSNKELVAEHGLELMRIARQNDVNYFFESAQELGYAERDPSADIDAFDPARKIAILASIAFGSSVDYRDVYTEGIRDISAEDIQYAATLGYAVKLLASAVKSDDGVRAWVAPMLISPDHPLYSINGVMNAVYVHGNMLGDAVFTGAGAGSLPTASAVVADVIDAARHGGKRAYCGWKKDEKLTLASNEDIKRKFLVRIKTEDVGNATSVFAPEGFLDTITIGDLDDEVAFITPDLSEKDFEERANTFGKIVSRIRIG